MEALFDHGVSIEAERLKALQQLPEGGLSSSVTLDRGPLLDELTDVICDFRGGADRLPPHIIDSYLQARRVAIALPQEISDPEVEIDPDGEVSFDWWTGVRRCFSLSVSGDGLLTFSGLIGQTPLHGTALFADYIPTGILSHIREVVEAG